jgi:hypothetical protein
MSLTISKEKAKRLYPEAPEWLKKDLVDEFGIEFFKEKNYEKIKTFKDACIALKIKTENLFNSNDTPDVRAYKQLKVIICAINEGWTPDWNNDNQRKYYPWFNLSSGFGFSSSGYGCGRTHTLVGSRLCFESEEKCIYTANQFLDIYKDFLN